MKYTKETLHPKLEEFLKPVLAHAGLEVSFELKTPENPHPEVENPEVTVHFSGPDVELLLENRAELLLALEHLSMEALRLAAGRSFADFIRCQRLPAVAHGRAAHERDGGGGESKADACAVFL